MEVIYQMRGYPVSGVEITSNSNSSPTVFCGNTYGYEMQGRRFTPEIRGCPNPVIMFKGRICKIRLRPKSRFLTGIKVTGIDKIGLISEITKILATEYNSDIRNFHFDSNGEVMSAAIMIMVTDTTVLNNIIEHVKNINDIKKVYRINNISEALL